MASKLQFQVGNQTTSEMNKNLPRRILAFGVAASMAPAFGISKPKDKDEAKARGNSPSANIEKQARKAERKAQREVAQVSPQAAQATEKIERQKPAQEAKQAQREMRQPAPQQKAAQQAQANAAEASAAAAEQERAEAMQQQLAEQAKNQKVTEQAREQKQRAEAAQANANARAEAMKDRDTKGPEPDVANRGAERAEAARAIARERAEAMKEAATEPAPQVTETSETPKQITEGIAETAEGRGKAMRPEPGERGNGNVVDAKDRLERAKNRAAMPDQPTEPAETTTKNPRERAEKMKKPAVVATGEPESQRKQKMDRENPETAAAESEQQAGREKQMAQASQQKVADTKTEATLAEADTAEKAKVTPEAQAERRQKARQDRTQQTAEVLRDQRRRADRDRRDDFRQRARNLDDDDDALELIAAALGGFAVGAVTSDLLDNRDDRYRYGRLPLSQVGRTRYEREATVGFLTRRFQGRASYDDAPVWFNSPYRDSRGSGHYHPYFYDNNIRVVRYSSYDAVPPVLLGYNRLNRVNVQTWADTPYYAAEQPEYYQQLPKAYSSEQAVAVSYPVDPDSAVTEDDILFEQGSTNLADAYSYDLIVDMAEAINSSELQNERFVVEGHASAEGGYSSNQQLSQDRAERIASDLVDLGVAADRIIPVGYGESEAQYSADAPESQRELDRRVMVFRLEQ